MTDMKLLRQLRRHSALTLVELLIYLGISAMISGVIFSFLTGASLLYAKNMSIVHSHTNLRSVLDRLTNNLQQAYSLPVLINTSGASAAAPAAGLYYDRYVGDPYLVTNASGTGLPATTTTLTLTCSTVALASPPAPKVGDAVLISDPNGNVRARISAVTAGTYDATNQRQPYTVTLAAALGTAISWSAPEVRVASLLHREAFVVVPGATQSEFRFYPNFEPVPVMTNPNNYTVISNQISSLAGETTPFSLDMVGTDRIVRASLFARSTEFSTWLTNKQANNFNTFVRLNAVLASRLRPKQ
jgi:hypothetical protein